MIDLLKEIHRIELEFYEKYINKTLTREEAEIYLHDIRMLRIQFYIQGR